MDVDEDVEAPQPISVDEDECCEAECQPAPTLFERVRKYLKEREARTIPRAERTANARRLRDQPATLRRFYARYQRAPEAVNIGEHQKFLVGSRKAKRKLMLEHMHRSMYRRLSRNPNATLADSRWVVHGNVMCAQSFAAMNFVTKRFLQQLVQELGRNDLDFAGTNENGYTKRTLPAGGDSKRVTCMMFLEKYLEQHATFLPDVKGGGYTLLIPQCSLTHIYHDDFMSWLKKANAALGPDEQLDTPSYQTFTTTLQAQYGHVKMTDKQRFTKCSTCATLQRKLERTQKEDITGQASAIILMMQQAHMEDVKEQKETALFWEEMAKAFPEMFLWTANDGMDSNKVTFPRSGPRLMCVCLLTERRAWANSGKTKRTWNAPSCRC